MTPVQVDFGDVQGVVRFGYKRLTEATYALVRVKSVSAAKAWLRTAPVTNASVKEPPPSSALQIAFTASGLETLGMPASVIAAFSPEFIGGMTEPSRSRRLGDIGADDPSQWEWGDQARVPHLLMMFFAQPGGLDACVQAVTGSAWNEAFEVLRWLKTADLDGVEPFGFADGLSQPAIDWSQERVLSAAVIDYTIVSALGEFLLGYRNEYGKYTDRPVIDPDAASADLPAAEDAPGKKDVGRNGTYLVVRQLRQDVRGFWQFIRQQAGADPVQADRLASLFVGRTPAGEPLVPIQDRPIPGIGSRPEEIRRNQFTFDGDPSGARCPFGAHVRRANPRNTDYPGRPEGLGRLIADLGLGANPFRDDLMSSVRFHRILRRGREYGPGLSRHQAWAPAPPEDSERGLHFICVNANISRQFEFLQNAWMVNSKFSGLTGESDPLVGTRAPIPGCPVTGDFTIQQDGGPPTRVSGLPQFVTVRGGAYFFLPGIRALRYIAGERA
jgi:deferrochelatase/peroxidase EfeB